MKLFGLSLVSAAAVAGFITMQAPSADAAVATRCPAVALATPSAVAEAGYYYYHGRRYPYRYHGQYFSHRYYRGNRYHYY